MYQYQAHILPGLCSSKSFYINLKGRNLFYNQCGRCSTYHLHTLHKRKPNSHVSRQADHTGRSIWCGLQQSHHSLHTHPACLHHRRVSEPQVTKSSSNGQYYMFKSRKWVITSILSKAEGVPPLCTWPRTVVRVSNPSFFDTSWTQSLWAANVVICVF